MEDIECGVTPSDSNPCVLISAKRIAEDDPKETDTLLELKTYQKEEAEDGTEPSEEPLESDSLLNDHEASPGSGEEDNGVTVDKAEDKVEVEIEVLPAQNAGEGHRKKKRGSTIDVVNCDETTEASETGSLSGISHVPKPKHGDPEEGPPPEGEEYSDLFDFREMAAGAMRHAEDLVRRMLMHVSWTICHFHSLPRWLQDNDFIWQGYRPPLPSFWDCIKSIFSIHTETGNIWTHMLGNVYTI